MNSLITYISLGIGFGLLVAAIAIYIVLRSNERLPAEKKSEKLQEKIERIGFFLKIFGAATVLVLGIINIWGLK